MSNTPGKPVRLFSSGVILALVLSALFFWVWYERYLSISFNEQGRYYDPVEQVVYTDAGFVWGLPAFGFLAFALVRMAVRLRQRRA